MAVLPKVRTALCAASQLPGEGPTDVEDAPAPARYQNPMTMRGVLGLVDRVLNLQVQIKGTLVRATRCTVLCP